MSNLILLLFKKSSWRRRMEEKKTQTPTKPKTLTLTLEILTIENEPTKAKRLELKEAEDTIKITEAFGGMRLEEIQEKEKKRFSEN